MDNQTPSSGRKNLNEVLFNRQPQTGGQQQPLNDSCSLNTYLNLFGVNLVHRFPDVSNLEVINYDTVRQIAEFSAVCSTIALETWDDISSRGVTQQRIHRQTRAG